MGHAHITDFNVAIHYSDRRMHTSVAGSMAYMAPQVVGKKGYSWQVDWWSLGVTAYELLFHKRPFDGRNAQKMTQSILKDPLTFPEDSAAHHSSAAISALRGVKNFNFPVFKLLAYMMNSSSIVILIHDWAAALMADSRISAITLGSPASTGMPLSEKTANRHLFLMYVADGITHSTHGVNRSFFFR
jgi:serine/threonine kinase 32